jgi:hypothetical protein
MPTNLPTVEVGLLRGGRGAHGCGSIFNTLLSAALWLADSMPRSTPDPAESQANAIPVKDLCPDQGCRQLLPSGARVSESIGNDPTPIEGARRCASYLRLLG